MDVAIRREVREDWHAVEALTRQAFWDPERAASGAPGCVEHYLVRLLRDDPAFVPELDLVAEVAGQAVGHVVFSRAVVEGDDGRRHEVLTFGPLSVLPAHQRQGVGSALMRHSLRVAAGLGFGAVLVFGHPSYYPRFGFHDAIEHGVTTADGQNFPAFMAVELRPGALAGVTGRLRLPSSYSALEPAAVAAYDAAAFPPT